MMDMKRIALLSVSVLALCVGGPGASRAEDASDKVAKKAFLVGHAIGHGQGFAAGAQAAKIHSAAVARGEARALTTSSGHKTLFQQGKELGKHFVAALDKAGHKVYDKAKGAARGLGRLAHKAEDKAKNIFKGFGKDIQDGYVDVKDGLEEGWHDVRKYYDDIVDDH